MLSRIPHGEQAFEHHKPIRPDVITGRGQVLEKRPVHRPGDHEVELERWAENQKGEKVLTGRATVTPPSRG